MIHSFRHKGLRRLFESGDTTGVQHAHVRKLQLVLAAIQAAPTVTALDLPGFKLHRLQGQQAGRWSIWINGNWRITFAFHDGDATLLDYEDYH